MYINPLDKALESAKTSTSSAETSLKSESLMMDDPTVCAKCNQKMQTCKLAGGEDGLHCGKCRTTGPIPE
tara:strand:+ start:10067 stop:10276 length:210 start_codon:yes stop_codon:yes gene_type:complete